MIVRSTASLLTIVMLLASGRLLACGWECIDELATTAAAACHQDSAPAAAVNGDAAHACLPEVTEPSITAAKQAKAHSIVAPLTLPFLAIERPLATPGRLRFVQPRSSSLYPHTPSILRI